MENESLHSLKLLFGEDIYLLPEEIDLILGQDKKEPEISIEVTDSSPSPYSSETEEPEEKEVFEVREATPPIVRGNFGKGIVVLHEEEELNEEMLDLLSKMISAVSHSMSDVGLLNSRELEGKSLEDFYAINAHKVIKFGKIAHPINALPIPDYQVKTEEETEFLFANSLTQISMDRSLKKKLWESLKTLFNVN